MQTYVENTSNIYKIFKVYSYSSKILEQVLYSFKNDILYDRESVMYCQYINKCIIKCTCNLKILLSAINTEYSE